MVLKLLLMKVCMIIIKIKDMPETIMKFQLMILMKKILDIMKLFMKVKKVTCTMKVILISMWMILMIVIIVKFNC